jgi:hypothetical protein
MKNKKLLTFETERPTHETCKLNETLNGRLMQKRESERETRSLFN